MKIVELSIYPMLLPMKQNLSISGGTAGSMKDGAPHVYVELVSDLGISGWGEARPSHRWSYETLESVTSTLLNYVKPVIIGMNAYDFVSIDQLINQSIARGFNSGQPIAKAAINIALHDLIARAENKQLTRLWQSSPATEINLSYLISTGSPKEAEEKAIYAVNSGYKGIDLKIGINRKLDVDILQAVKSAAPDLFLRVDANQAYNLPEAITIAKHMEKIGIDVFEQPMRANQLLAHAELRRKTSILIALDESIWTPSDLLQAIRLEACDYAVIKLTKMAGLNDAKLCGEIARAAGIGLLGGGLTESGLAFAASAQLFHHLKIETPVDLNGPFFLADDPMEEQLSIIEGNAKLPQGSGIGFSPIHHKLAQYSTNSSLK